MFAKSGVFVLRRTDKADDVKLSTVTYSNEAREHEKIPGNTVKKLQLNQHSYSMVEFNVKSILALFLRSLKYGLFHNCH